MFNPMGSVFGSDDIYRKKAFTAPTVKAPCYNPARLRIFTASEEPG